MGEGLQVDALEAWNRVGKALAAHDPESFRRHLMSAEAIVALYETTDPDRVLAERLELLRTKDEFDA